MAITQRRRFKTELSKARGKVAKAKDRGDPDALAVSLRALNTLLKQETIRAETPARRQALDETGQIVAAVGPAKASTSAGKSHGRL